MGTGSVAPIGGLGKWAALWLLVAGPGYPVRGLDGARFDERIRSDVTTRTGDASHQRVILRTARFGILLAGDTLVVSADSLALSETSNGATRALDTDGFVGGRYRMRLDSLGRAHLLERPFVPDELVEVSNLATAMDDFFPPAPPAMLSGTSVNDALGRQWRRLSDSSGVERYRWTFVDRDATPKPTLDSAASAVTTRLVLREEAWLAWDGRRGPFAWERHIVTQAVTSVRGRLVQASVEQRIAVRRLP